MKIDLLQNHPEYIEQVATWLYDQWGHLTEGASVGRSIQRLKQTPSQNGLPLSYIAIDGDEVVGVARVIQNDMSIRPDLFPWLASVYVHDKHRHKGIGRSLCYAAIQASCKLGFQTIYLFTPDKSHFYEKQGWKVIEEVDYRNQLVTIMCLEKDK